MRYKKILLLVTLHILLLNCYSQEKNGVNFDTTSTWEEIKTKAEIEHKLIFIDCYTTWCGYCKLLDKDIYPKQNIGKLFNEKFVCLRLQFDETDSDNQQIKKRHDFVRKIQSEYSINSFPTLLFLSASGKLLHKGMGYKDEENIIKLAMEAIDPTKQYINLKNQYESGQIKGESDIRNFITIALNNGDKKFAKEIATKFKKRYLDKLEISKLCTVSNIKFIQDFPDLITSNDNFFLLFYKYPQRVDSIRSGLSKRLVNYVITREEINSKIWDGNIVKNPNPNWDKISSTITKKYGKVIADRLIFPAKKNVAIRLENWDNYSHLEDLELSTKKVDSIDFEAYSWDINVAAWRIYLHCNDTNIIIKAIAWSDISIKLYDAVSKYSSEQYYDTKARLLYKIGRISDAIEIEKRAIEIGSISAKSRGEESSPLFNEYSLVLKKMENRESIKDLD